jgi:hypothetical protein
MRISATWFVTFGFVLAAGLAGCSAGHDASTTGLPATSGSQSTTSRALPNKKKPVLTMYVANRDSGAILGFPTKNGGNIVPSVTITGSNTMLGNPVALAADSAGNLYCANDSGNEVLIFAAGSNGNATPQVLGGSNVPLTATEGIAIDASGQIYVSDFRAPAVLVFAAGATGNTAPIRTIAGPDTGLTQPTGMAFDSKGNLYVANYSGAGAPVVEFAPNANGDAEPIGSIGMANGGGKSGLYSAFSVSLNSSDDIIVPNDSIPGISIFKKGAKGNVKPNAVISGSSTGITDLTSVGLDAKGLIYATNFSGSGNDQVLVFSAKAKGNVAPLHVFGGALTGLGDPFYPTVI